MSCQALPGNPLKGSVFMSAMALAAVQGGASAIRANGPEDISAIRQKVKVPIIGINKLPPSDGVYITPSFNMAEEVALAGADIIALDATGRPRPGGETLAELVDKIKTRLKLPVMGDISTFDEGMAAIDNGCDIIATTLSGYTGYTEKTAGPDLGLVEKLAANTDVPVIAEGRYQSPDDMLRAFEAGAFAVIIGKAISNPEFITKKFTERLKK